MEPPASGWALGLENAEPGEDLVGVGADLEPGTILMGYRRGLFPMGLGRRGHRPMGWWSPDPRGILPLERLHVSRSLRRSMTRFEIRVNTAFEDVVAGCADPSRDGPWITGSIARAYLALHRLGWAHSVECWSGGRLAGGLYGVAIGGLFAGESMFHVDRDASKVAVAALVRLLDPSREQAAEPGSEADGGPKSTPPALATAPAPPAPPAPSERLFDVQWRTDHLATLGVVAVPRSEYLQRLERALPLPLPAAFSGSSGAVD
jgi:leucyl/phenylalanyl-tRNA--protein transferase